MNFEEAIFILKFLPECMIKIIKVKNKLYLSFHQPLNFLYCTKKNEIENTQNLQQMELSEMVLHLR